MVEVELPVGLPTSVGRIVVLDQTDCHLMYLVLG